MPRAEMHTTLIRNAMLVMPDGVRPGDLAIEGGTIVEIADSIRSATAQTIDATGLHVFPGGVDSHVHFNEPGRTDWEGVTTGSAALVAGGGTTYVDMPLNSSPPVLDVAALQAKRDATASKSYADYAFWGGLTPANLDQLEALAAAGVVGFKAFMSGSGIDDFKRVDDVSLWRGMQTAARLNLPVAVHAESDNITALLSAEAITAGKTTIADYLASRPAVAEAEAIARAILLAEETGCRLHVVHVSTGRGVERVRLAAARGVPVTCETCPHYLLLNEADVMAMGAKAKCAPPLRPAVENANLWDAIRDGLIYTVGSDHSPAPASMKTSADFFKVWGGIAGVQSTLSALCSGTPELPAETIASMFAGHPASLLKLPKKGRLEVGYDADFALVDLSTPATLLATQLLDRHKQSPYVGRTFDATISQTWLRGQCVYADGALVGKPRGMPISSRGIGVSPMS